MKYKLQISISIFLLVLCPIHPQSGWQWQTPSPTGNTYNTIQFIDSLNGWIGGGGGSIVHTNDGGITWEVQSVGVHIYLHDLFFADINNGWVVGVEPGGGPSYILHTGNGGVTWEVQFENDSFYGNETIDFVNKTHGWIVRKNTSILHTNDGGLNWQEQLIPGLTPVKSVDFVDQRHGWAVGDFEQIFMTSDGGENWGSVTLPDSLITNASWGRVAFADSLTGWIFGGDILKTNDGGITWHKQREHATNITDISIVDEHVVYASLYSGRMLKTLDGGETWSIVEADSVYSLSSTHFITPNYGWSVGPFATLLSTSNGGVSWTNHTNMIGDYLTLMHFSVDFVDEYYGWISGVRGSIYHTTDGGLTWDEQSTGTDEELRAIQFINNQKGWTVGTHGTILKTIDGGNTWLDRSYGVMSSFNDVNFITDQTGWIVGGDFFQGGIVLHTNNGGDSWSVQTSGTFGELEQVTFFDSLNGFVTGASETNFMMKTSDGGQSWELFTLPGGSSHFRSFFLNSSTGWIINEIGKVYHTADAGETWVLRATKPVASDIIFIDEYIGWVSSGLGIIYHTEDGGWTWTKQPSLTSNQLTSIDFIDRHTGWAVGAFAILHTETGGKLKTEGGGEFNTINPVAFILHQNYPNPFNAITHVSIRVIDSQIKGRLEVFNLTGKRIAILFNDKLDVGYHTFQWNSKNANDRLISSGIYIFRFTTELSSKAIKTVYIK